MSGVFGPAPLFFLKISRLIFLPAPLNTYELYFHFFSFRQDQQDYSGLFFFLTSQMEVRKLNPLSAE